MHKCSYTDAKVAGPHNYMQGRIVMGTREQEESFY